MDIKSFGSSSAGNCILINKEILLDCGIKDKEVLIHTDFNLPQGILLTHSHKDHSKYAKDWTKRGVPIYLSQGELDAMDAITITKELYESAKRLEKGSSEIFILAREQAEKERDYRRELAHEIMKLRSEGMSVTLINDLARGNTSDYKFERDLSEAKYTAARDSLKAIAVQVNALQSILRIQSEV